MIRWIGEKLNPIMRECGSQSNIFMGAEFHSPYIIKAIPRRASSQGPELVLFSSCLSVEHLGMPLAVGVVLENNPALRS
jgi:hypothetical protein